MTGHGPGRGNAIGLVSIGEFARRSRLSPKALRLYDELGLLLPASVDPVSGYRWYDIEQLEAARLVASLRQLGVPLAQITVILALDARAAAVEIAAYWSVADAEHRARSELAYYLVDRLNGKRSNMYEVNVREVPARQLLCVQRNVANDEEVFSFGKEFIALFRDNPVLKDKPVPRFDDGLGDAYLIYHGEVNEDSDGPVEWCRRVPDIHADELAAKLPSLTLRTEPAHKEAFVKLGTDQPTAAEWQLISGSLYAWASDHHQEPSELGVRVAFRATPPITPGSRPDCDFAVPLR